MTSIKRCNEWTSALKQLLKLFLLNFLAPNEDKDDTHAKEDQSMWFAWEVSKSMDAFS